MAAKAPKRGIFVGVGFTLCQIHAIIIANSGIDLLKTASGQGKQPNSGMKQSFND
ncbi:hypothetical protein SLIQ_09765 [Serratia liquefaciens FK01]|nr:hypothetical protein SLIQ_09765 [Serratia liquefaciens FK01]